MKPVYRHVFLVAALMLGACAKESPFSVDTETGEGQILKSAVNVDLRDGEMGQTTVRSAASSVSYDDFKVIFTKEGDTAPTASYRYGEMPEIVTLARGVYVATATFGEDLEAEWENPYYVGRSEAFTIRAGEITDNIGDIVCRLENVKVSVDFAPILTQEMDESAFVEVKVVSDGKDSKGLRFTKSEENSGISGYFKHADGVSLVATFNGLVEGIKVSETKSIPVVQKGYHYKITFKLHTQNGENQGDATLDMKLDASVTVTDVERNVDLEEDEILDDDERPVEGPDTPVGPDDPQPPVSADGPVVEAEGAIDLDKVNDVSADSKVVLNISSDSGITEFIVKIASAVLNEELGITELDLVEPGENRELLFELGLLSEERPTMKGEKDVKFDISSFMELLLMLGSDINHTFIIEVADDSGSVKKELRLHTI